MDVQGCFQEAAVLSRLVDKPLMQALQEQGPDQCAEFRTIQRSKSSGWVHVGPGGASAMLLEMVTPPGPGQWIRKHHEHEGRVGRGVGGVFLSVRCHARGRAQTGIWVSPKPSRTDLQHDDSIFPFARYFCVLEAVRYMLRRRGVSRPQLKQLTYSLRREMLTKVKDDLEAIADPAARWRNVLDLVTNCQLVNKSGQVWSGTPIRTPAAVATR